MRAWMLGGMALYAANLTGCVISNSDGSDPWDDDSEWWNDGDEDGDEDDLDDTATDTDTTVDNPAASFALDPATVEIGDTALVTITSADGFDFSAVASVNIDGPITVNDVLVRPDEVNVVLTVSAEAAAGASAAVWVVLDDGTAWLLDATLSVVEADDNPCD